MIQEEIPQKANWVLNLILAGMILILLRAWHLAVVQHEERREEAEKPQHRTIIEPAKRGTIRDRFNIPLAINKIQYNAAVLYAPIRGIPAFVWEKVDGKRVKRFKRKEHIRGLAEVLARELEMESDRIEDLIHAKASLYNQVPFVLKEDITEEQYYRLKMLEREWQGIQVQRVPKRLYPHGKLASDIIGYMGAINREEYEAIFQEMRALKEFLTVHELGENPSFPSGFDSISQVLRRLKDLEEHSYTMNDYVGKAGVEGRMEEELRGFHGKRSFYSDARGNFLRELPGAREPFAGKRILLTISAELQQFAEQLLMENEPLRKSRISGMSAIKQELIALHEPWIKGGSIVAIDPNTGEILALASYPRIDPNDFIVSGNRETQKAKKGNILRWFESEEYLAAIWDQKRPLEREFYDSSKKRYYEDKMWLTWQNYLRFILPEHNEHGETHDVLLGLQRIGNIKNAVALQTNIDKLLALSGNSDLYALLNVLYPEDETVSDVAIAMRDNLEQHEKYVQEARQKIDELLSFVKSNDNKVLVIDLIRLLVCEERFDEALIAEVGGQSLEQYRDVSAAWVKIDQEMREMARNLFHEIDFALWREKEGKEFLKAKRAEEKAAGRYPKPYIDHLDRKEKELFEAFWREHRYQFALSFLLGKESSKSPYEEHFLSWQQELRQGAHRKVEWREAYDKLVLHLPFAHAVEYLQGLRSFEELNRPLFGHYPFLRKSGTEKDLALAFYPRYGFGYGRSYAYRQATHQGSIFKLVVAYEALVERYSELAVNQEKITLEALNPLEIVDSFKQRGKHKIVGYHEDGKPIYQLYKGGRIPKTAVRDVGHLNILTAIEFSSNPYFALLAGDVIKDPENLITAARQFSYGEKTGIDLPAEIKGSLPKDLRENKTGLYTFAMGQHAFVATPLQTAVMLSALANGGKVLRPKIVSVTAGRQPRLGQDRIVYDKQFPYRESLALLGVDFPLFTESIEKKHNLVQKTPVEVRRELFLPGIIRQILLEGMQRVLHRTQSQSLLSLVELYRKQPEMIRDFESLKEGFVGKSSTSESVEKVNIDPKLGTHKFMHIWFGGISFEVERDKGILVAEDTFGRPELVVVVYLRYGEWGKEAAPVAAQIVKRWREIKTKMG